MKMITYIEDGIPKRADMVEVIRCKDCKYFWRDKETCIHENHRDGIRCITNVKEDHYCGYAERL